MASATQYGRRPIKGRQLGYAEPVGAGWAALTYNHEDSTAADALQRAGGGTGAFPPVLGAAIPVSGIRYDVDSKNLRRAIFGGNAGAIDHTVQDSLKLRLGYALTREVEASAIFAGWRNDSENSDVTFLRDAGGNAVWEGRVSDGTNTFNIPPTAFAPSTREEKHRQLGLTLRTTRERGWNGSAVVSDYRILEDRAPGEQPRPGSRERRARHSHAPRRDGLEHAGGSSDLHAPHRRLAGRQARIDPWRPPQRLHPDQRREQRRRLAARRDHPGAALPRGDGSAGTVRPGCLAAPRRLEADPRLAGRAFPDLRRRAACPGGVVRRRGGAACAPNGDGTFDKVVGYASRSLSGRSPKARSRGTPATPVAARQLRTRASPNVEGSTTARSRPSVTLSDPNLEAERSNAYELSAETFLEEPDAADVALPRRRARRHPAPERQHLTPSITQRLEPDLVRTSGVEVAWSARDVVVRGLSIEANGPDPLKVVENARTGD